MDTLYIFIDESGNLDFSPKGTAYFVLAAITAISPLNTASALQALKYNLLKENYGGKEFQHFHATEDKQWIRDRVFSEISKMKEQIKINYLFAKKSKTHPSFQNRASFYSLLGGAIAKYLILSADKAKYEKVVIVFDKALTHKEQDAFYKKVKPKLKILSWPYAIYFHQTVSDFNGQIADYAAWAKFVSLEREEMRPLESLCAIPSTSFDIFKNGTTDYY